LESQQLGWITNFIWGIADDVLRDVYVRGKYRDVILPMVVIRRLDAVLESTSQRTRTLYGNAADYVVAFTATPINRGARDLMAMPGVQVPPDMHPIVGAHLVSLLPSLGMLAPMIRSHHERWDGRGFPDMLAGEAVPLGARILAVAEAYVSLTAEDEDRARRTTDGALAVIRKGAGSRFDPVVVEALAHGLRSTCPPRAAVG
jgi:hypothetical protein